VVGFAEERGTKLGQLVSDMLLSDKYDYLTVQQAVELLDFSSALVDEWGVGDQLFLALLKKLASISILHTCPLAFVKLLNYKDVSPGDTLDMKVGGV